ncbi:hypothetical protein B0H13DRAFT_921164 [Mycena leptocephala]|nr:hypothetical protein B0H13DRAFT_921164 [Mycena leptocephala]
MPSAWTWMPSSPSCRPCSALAPCVHLLVLPPARLALRRVYSRPRTRARFRLRIHVRGWKGTGERGIRPNPEDALLRADFGRGYEDLPLEWRNNPWIVEGYRFILLTHWPALVCSVFTLHNESPNIRTHFVPMVLLGAAFWGVGVRVLGFLKPLAP